ncbi:hypothetical protein BH11PAT1_BH11PAT1_1260 [soil metagenome]
MKKDYISKRIYSVSFFILLAIPAIFAFLKVLSGNIPFWYDPARDLLLAWDNLGKISLIGPTTGIPGIFYGPFWIWFLSFGLLFSKDPRIPVLVVLTIPYFIFLPVLLFYKVKLFDRLSISIVWLLYAFSFAPRYGEAPWNPHLASFFMLILLFILLEINFEKKGRKNILLVISAGIISGLVLNTHISFGLGSMIATILFFILFGYRSVKPTKNIINYLKSQLLTIYFLSGVLLTFTPFLIFESRHGFNQLKTIFATLSSSVPVVTVKGLSKEQIIFQFYHQLSELFHSSIIFTLLIIIGIGIIIWQWYKKQLVLDLLEKKLLVYSILLTICILTIYLSSKNPVWSYHFIGVEVIGIFFILFLLKKSLPFRYILACITIYVICTQIPGLFNKEQQGNTLNKEITITKLIIADAKESDYSVFAYSPSIYTYEYSYLFRWLAKKDIPYDPGSQNKDKNNVFLILPSSMKAKEKDFIEYYTPQALYQSAQSWQIGDRIVGKRTRK